MRSPNTLVPDADITMLPAPPPELSHAVQGAPVLSGILPVASARPSNSSPEEGQIFASFNTDSGENGPSTTYHGPDRESQARFSQPSLNPSHTVTGPYGVFRRGPVPQQGTPQDRFRESVLGGPPQDRRHPEQMAGPNRPIFAGPCKILPDRTPVFPDPM